MAAPTPTPEPPKRSNNRTAVIILSIAVVVLGGLLVWQSMSNADRGETVEQLETNKQELEAEMSEIQQQRDELEKLLRDKNIDADEKQRRIEELIRQMEGLQGRVNQMIASGKAKDKELDRLKQLVEDLEFLRARYESRIATLENQNQELAARGDSLAGQVDTLSQERAVLQGELEDKKTILKAASVLRVADFTFSGLKDDGSVRGSGLMLRRNQLKDALRVCFEVLENAAAETGSREAYVVVKNPNNQVIQSFETSSGYFTYNGQERVYTMKVTFTFSNKREAICAEFDVPDDFDWEKGTHTVEVYIGNQKSGDDSFLVKSFL